MNSEQAQNVYRELHKTPLFRYFDQQDLLDILLQSTVRRYAEKTPVIVEGEVGPDFYIVISGSVDVTVKEQDREVFICTIGQGEFFGEAGIFAKVKRTANIVASENSTVLKVERTVFLDFIRKRPTSGIKMLMIIIYSLLKKLRGVNQELAFERKFDIEQDDIDEIIRGIVEG